MSVQSVDFPGILPRRRFGLTWWWIIPLLLLAFWLGARSLSTNPVWGDEINSLRDAGNLKLTSPIDLWKALAQTNPTHTPGYFVLLNLWSSVAGQSREVLRVLTVLFGLAGIAWTYRLGSDLLGTRAGLYGAAVLATSMLYVHYLTKIRMYEMITLLTALTLCVYFRVVSRRHKPGIGLWLLLFISAVGLLYTHYIAALVLLAIGFYHLLFVRKDRRWWQVVGVLALAGLLFLPWVSALRTGVEMVSGDDVLHSQALTAREVVAWLAFLFGNGRSVILIPPMLLAVYAAWRFPVRRAAIGGRRLWFFFVVILVLVLIVNAAAQMIIDNRARYLMALWPLLALIVGFGLTQLDRWLPRLGAIVLVAWLAFGVRQSASTLMSMELDGFSYVFPISDVVSVIDGQTESGDLLLIDLPDNGLLPRRYQSVMTYYFASTELETAFAPRDGVLLEGQIPDQQSRLWLAYAPDHAPAHLKAFQAALRQKYTYCARVGKENKLVVELYARTQAACGSPNADSSAPG